MDIDNIYFDMVDPTKAGNLGGLYQEAEKMKRLDEFRMQQQVNSPIYQKLIEQNSILSKQNENLIKQNDLIKQQLELAIQEKQQSDIVAKKAKRLNIFMATISAMSLIGMIIDLIVNIVK